ncbi:MAG: ABC transporter ATP-binding protein [Clostridiales Family XIII bacterium]|jgi:branched-chain amino acid transport system ATP-binding protein|nr:ABC transporter ATP-binding protein [Clostridiales Family XIII bacterium]
MSEKILQVEGVTKRFGGLVAVDNVTFDVNPSEIFGIIGPNGAGKSTTLALISGFLSGDAGKVFFDGRDVTGFKPHQIAQAGIGRQFQVSRLFMELSCIENVFSGLHMGYKTSILQRFLHVPAANKETQELRRKAEDILEFMGLSHLRDEPAKNLPHGYQRILSMCIALATDPKLLMLDEPITGMNETEIEGVLELFKQILDRGVTIMIIEHNMDVMMSLCDRMIVLDFGKKIAEGTPKVIQSNDQVIEAYLGTE